MDNATFPFDQNEFDGSFACDCGKTGFGGANCDSISGGASSAASSDDGSGATTVAAAVSVGALLCLVLFVLLAWRYRTYLVAIAPVDFKKALEDLLEAGEIEAKMLGGEGERFPVELNRSAVTLTKRLGAGAFGEVWLAVLETAAGGPRYSRSIIRSQSRLSFQRLVGVKLSQRTEGTADLVKEAALMSQAGCGPRV